MGMPTVWKPFGMPQSYLDNLEKITGGGSSTTTPQPTYSYDNGAAPSFTPPVMPTIDPYKAPDPYVAPAPYAAPVYDENRVSALTQENAAPAVRGLRSAIQRVTSSSDSNPNAKRMTLRDALAGYGQGLQNAVSGAATTARGLYNTEYGIAADESKTNYGTAVDTSKTNYNANVETGKINYQTEVSKAMATYQASLDAYMAQVYGKGATKYGSYSNQNNTAEAPTATQPASGGQAPVSRIPSQLPTEKPQSDPWTIPWR